MIYKSIMLATGPFHNPGDGMQQRRAVLKGVYKVFDPNISSMLVEYIIHTEYVDEDGANSFGNGDYIPVREENDKLFSKVWKRFAKRCEELASDPICNVVDQPIRFKKYLPHLETKGKG